MLVSRVAMGEPNTILVDVFGTRGVASFDMRRPGEIKIIDDTEADALQGVRRVLVNPEFPYFKDGNSMAFGGVGVTQIDQFVYQARAFLGQVAGVDEGLPPVPSFAAGYRAMLIQDAIAKSAANDGRAVKIGE